MQTPLANQLIVLLAAFVLTTVAGSFLAFYFQNRTWKQQKSIKLAETERIAATKIFEDVSSLMDKRLYRMRQLAWKIKNESSVLDDLEKSMDAYREILYEWNDGLNRNLAFVQCYFGKDIRKILEGVIYEKFKEIGVLIEQGYLERKNTGKATNFQKAQPNINELRDEIYRLNVKMIELIQQGEIGIFNPDTSLKAKKLILR